jgi:hypothetical protein
MYLQVKLMEIRIFFFGLSNSRKSYSSTLQKMLVLVIPVSRYTDNIFHDLYT